MSTSIARVVSARSENCQDEDQGRAADEFAVLNITHMELEDNEGNLSALDCSKGPIG
jgi:hypothetical protein